MRRKHCFAGRFRIFAGTQRLASVAHSKFYSRRGRHRALCDRLIVIVSAAWRTELEWRKF